MIIKAPRWRGTGLRGVRRGLGQDPSGIGPPEIFAGPSGEGLTTSDIQQMLGSMDLTDLSTTLSPFLASGTSVYGTSTTSTSAVSGTTLLIIAAVFLGVVMLGAKR